MRICTTKHTMIVKDYIMYSFIEVFKALSHEILQADERRLRERLKLRENGKYLLGVQKTCLLSGKVK